MAEQEPLPISDFIKVLKYEDVYKTAKWWCAIVIGEQMGRKKLFAYLWTYQNGKWKRKQKLTIPTGSNWNKMLEIIGRFQVDMTR